MPTLTESIVVPKTQTKKTGGGGGKKVFLKSTNGTPVKTGDLVKASAETGARLSLLKEQVQKNRHLANISKIKKESSRGLDAPATGLKGLATITQSNKQHFENAMSNQGKPVLHRMIKFKEAEVMAHPNDDLKAKYKPINDVKKLYEAKAKAKAEKEAAAQPVDDNILPQPKKVLCSMEELNGLLGWRSVGKIGGGLRNLGNTCFMNSVLQCLSYSPPLANYMLSKAHSSACDNQGFCMFCALEKHIRLVLEAGGRVVTPKEIAMNMRKIAPSFRLGRQEDSHEFIRFVIEGLQKAALQKHPKGSISHRDSMTSVVGSIFGGYLRSQVKCTQCQYESNTFDPFMDLSVDINHADTLTKGLNHFTKAEFLDGSNKYKCSKCKKLVRASKQLKIHIAPPVLTIQLKRFSFMGMFGGKINKPVSFEPALNLAPFMTQTNGPVIYDLYGVLTHLGGSTNSGHYFCFAKGSNGVWNKLDDEIVSQVSLETVLSQKAYILFYSKRPSPNNISTNTVSIPSTITTTTPVTTTTLNKNGKRPLEASEKASEQQRTKQIKLETNKSTSPSPSPSPSPKLSSVNAKPSQQQDTVRGDESESDGSDFSDSDSVSSLSEASTPSPLISSDDEKIVKEKKVKTTVAAPVSKINKTWEEVLTDKQSAELDSKKFRALRAIDQFKKPQQNGNSKEKSQFQFKVAKWNDDPDTEENKAQQELLKDEALQELSHAKDSWNEEFDQGRQKKIKIKTPLDPNAVNNFELMAKKKARVKEMELKNGGPLNNNHNNNNNHYNHNSPKRMNNGFKQKQHSGGRQFNQNQMKRNK